MSIAEEKDALIRLALAGDARATFPQGKAISPAPYICL